MKRLAWILVPLLLLSLCSRPKHAPTIRFPYLWLGVQGFGGDIDQSDLTEPSGIAYHRQRDTLFAVSDDGVIAEFKRDGTPVARYRIGGDLEAVTIVPETGLVYVAVEGDDVILEFDPVGGEVTRRFPINRTFNGDPNFLKKQTDEFDNGIESMTFVPDPDHPEGGTFYVGNQWNPSVIMEVLVPLKSSRVLEEEARIIRVLPFKMDDPAAMYYDPEKRLLNVVSDADNILVEITLDGKLVRQYAFVGNDQEGVCVDDEGFLYITQDTGEVIKVKDLRPR